MFVANSPSDSGEAMAPKEAVGLYYAEPGSKMETSFCCGDTKMAAGVADVRSVYGADCD